MSRPVRRRWLAPEVIQTSAMDCGPAALKCLLEGHGVSASYGRLREACQTDVDGTSIDTLEEVAQQLGLEAEQIVVPPEHLFVPEADALPALVVVLQPNGFSHFVVAWRTLGPYVQVMDPAAGRRWVRQTRFLADVYRHAMPVAAAEWHEWALSDDFTVPLARRLGDLGIAAAPLIERAKADAHWHALAALEASCRMLSALVRGGALRRGREAERILVHLLARLAAEGAVDQPEAVPAIYWSVRPLPDQDGEAQVLMRGAVLLRVKGCRAEAAKDAPRELAAALEEPASRPIAQLLGFLKADGALAPTALAFGFALAAFGVVLEALLFRALLGISHDLGLVRERYAAMAALILLVGTLSLIELASAGGAKRLGRQLELRLRTALLAKLPRLTDRYFQSRPISDMADRAHAAHHLRGLPELAGQLLRAFCEVVAIVVAIAWLYPASGGWAALAGLVAVGLPLALQPALIERDHRFRTHRGGLGRYYLDALVGLMAIRTHRAERAVRREHEGLLVEWMRAGLEFQRTAVAAEAWQAVLGFGLAAWIVVNHLAMQGPSASTLLLAYWALMVPALGQEIGQWLRQYPAQRNTASRMLEPLGALEAPPGEPAPPPAHAAPGLAVRFADVSVVAGGHPILEQIDLELSAGSHIAVVGRSGAGKSSLAGLLLGWHEPAAGHVLVDGAPVTPERLARLRRETVWIDPAVHLWNRPLLENLLYGVEEPATSLDRVLEEAELLRLLEQLPEGLQTPLGDGGALVSGGEGQRVRLGRAWLRSGARLVILDEPFRGLDRERRRALLARARARWRDATLVCITHDVGETLEFERVLVVEGGQVVEDAAPRTLAEQPDSRYRQLLESEQALAAGVWHGPDWRRWRLAGGKLSEETHQLGASELRVPR